MRLKGDQINASFQACVVRGDATTLSYVSTEMLACLTVLAERGNPLAEHCMDEVETIIKMRTEAKQ